MIKFAFTLQVQKKNITFILQAQKYRITFITQAINKKYYEIK